MSLFTTAQSEEVSALQTAQTLLSQCSALQTLMGTAGDSTATLAKGVLGPMDPPHDHEAFERMQEEAALAWWQLYPQLEDGALVSMSAAVGATPEKEGLFHLHVHRHVRAKEYADTNGRRDAWLYFLDQTSRMKEEFIAAADLNLFAGRIARDKGPFYNPLADHQAQGIFLFADFTIQWGGSEHAGGQG